MEDGVRVQLELHGHVEDIELYESFEALMITALTEEDSSGFFIDTSHVLHDTAGSSKLEFLSKIDFAQGLCVEPSAEAAKLLQSEARACKVVHQGFVGASGREETGDFLFAHWPWRNAS